MGPRGEELQMNFFFTSSQKPLFKKKTSNFIQYNKFYKPIDVSTLIETGESIAALLENLQRKAYEVAKFKIELKNQAKNKGYGLFVQYAPRDYILLVEEGTQNVQEKTKLSWLGPYQVVEVISTNVYQMESITGKPPHGPRIPHVVSFPPKASRGG
eukprot:maker-scaffold_32-snap-gene-2.60-mRNA-1 protein AED:0.36 eAED:0.43 QI:0/0/0/0.5/1/1/2/0/155